MPVAPAIVVDGELFIQGRDIADDLFVGSIREKLGMPTLAEEKPVGILGRLFGKGG